MFVNITKIQKIATKLVLFWSGTNIVQPVTIISQINVEGGRIKLLTNNGWLEFDVYSIIEIIGDSTRTYTALNQLTTQPTAYNTRFQDILQFLVLNVLKGCCCDDASGGNVSFVTTLPSTGVVDILYVQESDGTLWYWDGAAFQPLGGGGGVNLYNSDGTLTANRTVTGAEKSLTFNDLTDLEFNASSSITDNVVSGADNSQVYQDPTAITDSVGDASNTSQMRLEADLAELANVHGANEVHFAARVGELFARTPGVNAGTISLGWFLACTNVTTGELEFQPVSVSIPDASPTVRGIAKLYTATGTNTDGSMDQNSITNALALRLLASANLSDLANIVTARQNLGGTTVGINFFISTNPSAITFPRVNADNTVSYLSAAAFLSAIGGQASGNYLITTNNLSDLTNAATARTNLGLGTAAVQNVAFFLQAANNLSDVANIVTARTNLGATTVGANFFTLANPSAIRFPRINADNTVSALTAAQMLTALGAGNEVLFYIGQYGTTIAASTTNYFPMSVAGPSGVEVNRSSIFGYAGTIKNLYIYIITAQPASGSYVWTFRKATLAGAFSSQAVTVTIAAGSAAGVYSDIVNSFTVAETDRGNIMAVNNATATSAQVQNYSFVLQK